MIEADIRSYIEPNIERLVRLVNKLPFLATDQSCGGHLERAGCSYRVDPLCLMFFIERDRSPKRRLRIDPIGKLYIDALKKKCVEYGKGEVLLVHKGERLNHPLYHFDTGRVEYLDSKEAAKESLEKQILMVKDIERLTEEFLREYYC